MRENTLRTKQAYTIEAPSNSGLAQGEINQFWLRSTKFGFDYSRAIFGQIWAVASKFGI